MKAPISRSSHCTVGRARARAATRSRIVLGHPRDGQPEEVLELEGGDDHRDPRREPGGDRIGHELDQPAQAEDPHENQDDPGHQGGNHQAADPEPGGDRAMRTTKAAVGPETWTMEPPSAAITTPAMMAV